MTLTLAACGGGTDGSTTTSTTDEPIRTGAVLTKPLIDYALVGQPYEATVRVTAIDKRNNIVSLSISNPTAGGAQPSINNAGKVTWTPNEADFASTTQLKIVAKLNIGADQELLTPVAVKKYRQVFEAQLDANEKTYSDADGRYLIRVKRDNAALPISGTLHVYEVFAADGTFISKYFVTGDTNNNSVLEIIEAPVSSNVAVGAITTQSSPYPLSVLSTTLEQGSVLDGGINVYTSQPRVTWRVLTTGGVLGIPGISGSATETKVSTPAETFQFLGSCATASACTDSTKYTKAPVILIHGYSYHEVISENGGEGTWGGLPDALLADGRPVFEMRWITGMRFKEAAGMLTRFGEVVAKLTGQKPIIMAHSFGGITSHLALQNKGIIPDGGGGWKNTADANKFFSQLITFDSPLSGIADDTYSESTDVATKLTYGRDYGDTTINGCYHITCWQAGAVDMNMLEVANFKNKLTKIDGVSAQANYPAGEAIKDLQSGNTSVPFLTVASTNMLPKDYSQPFESRNMWKLGDGLISLIGQAFDPKDFANNPYSANLGNIFSDYNYNFDFKLPLDDIKNMDTGDACVRYEANSRKYWICGRGAHTNTDLHRTHRNDYAIAYYESPLDNLKNDFPVKRHPLHRLINAGDATPTPDGQPAHTGYGLVKRAPYSDNTAVLTSNVKGRAVAGSLAPISTTANTGLKNILIWATFIDKATGQEKKSFGAATTNDNGDFQFDLGQQLASAFGSEVQLSAYKVKLKMGDGLRTKIYTQEIENLQPLHDLGDIDLTLNAALVNVSGRVIDGQTSGTPIPNAEIWLSQGIDQSAARLRLLVDNKIARKVVSDANGNFSVTGIQPGDYSILVSKAGYSDQLQGRVTLTANGVLNLSLLRILNTGEGSVTLRWANSSAGAAVASDLDSHLLRFSAGSSTADYHIYYANRAVAGLLDSLDRDDTDYEGPETVTFAPIQGKNYVYYVHNYSGGSGTFYGSFPRVTLRLGASTYTFDVPSNGNSTARYWRVFDLVNNTVVRCTVNCLQSAAPAGIATQSGFTPLASDVGAYLSTLPSKR